MSYFQLCPPERKWKSNLINILCRESNSDDIDHFVSKLVRTIYKRIGFSSFPIEINNIADMLDVVSIIDQPLSNDIDAVLGIAPNGYKITINSLIRDQRRRKFSCCHEFGHILIMRHFNFINIDNYSLPTDSTNDFLEEEFLCQKIAAAILMPPDEFKNRAIKLNPSIQGIKQLADYFDTTFSATLQRLLELECWNFDLLHCFIVNEEVHHHKVINCNYLNDVLIEDILFKSTFPYFPYMAYEFLADRLCGIAFEIETLSKTDTALFIWDKSNNHE